MQNATNRTNFKAKCCELLKMIPERGPRTALFESEREREPGWEQDGSQTGARREPDGSMTGARRETDGRQTGATPGYRF